jgi:hypothetical protein
MADKAKAFSQEETIFLRKQQLDIKSKIYGRYFHILAYITHSAKLILLNKLVSLIY